MVVCLEGCITNWSLAAKFDGEFANGSAETIGDSVERARRQ